MIIGIGTDIVNIQRIQNIYNKFGESFLHKNFHTLEIKIFETVNQDQKLHYLAKRFAAKEALSKALGTGICNGLSFKDIATINNEFGAPKVIISNKSFPELSQYNINISLSDDYPFALAFVVIVK